MEPISNLVNQALTEMRTPQTPVRPVNTNEACEAFGDPFHTLGDPHLESLLTAATAFKLALKAGRPAHWLSLLGATGNGKTYLARAIYKFARKLTPPRSACPERTRYPWDSLVDGARVQWIDWRSFCDSLLHKEWWRVSEVCDAWVVVIDDIATEHDPTGVLKSALDRIANSRLGMWTVFTSNKFYDQIADQIDVRVASRMKRGGSIVVETDTLDYSLR